MTRRALKPCGGSPLCPELVRPPARYCDEHTRAREQDRGTPYARGYDAAWRKTRTAYRAHRLATDGVLACDECGITEDDYGAPLHVDHLDGLGPHGPRGHDFDNLQLLCPPHHSTKTAIQTGTAGGPQ